MILVGQALNKELFYVVSVKEKETTQKKPYLSICLANATEKVWTNLWDRSLSNSPMLEGDYIYVSALVGEYNGSIQLQINNIEKAEGISLAPVSSKVELGDLKTRFYKIVDTVSKDSESGQLLKRILADTDLMDKFFSQPAAVEMHHNYVHGLLQHCISVAEFVSERVSTREYNIGVVAALMHDIGKIDCYEFVGPTVKVAEKGRFIDHITNGAMILMNFLDGVRPEFIYPFINAILGHHGSLEFGSPVLPKTPFAWLIYHADLWDSHTQHLNDLEDWQGWSNKKDRMFNLELYRI